MCTPAVISWFITYNPSDYSYSKGIINQSFWSYDHQLSYRLGAPLCIFLSTPSPSHRLKSHPQHPQPHPQPIGQPQPADVPHRWQVGGQNCLVYCFYTHTTDQLHVLSYTYVLYVFIKSMCMIMFTIYVNEYIMYRQPFLELKNSALGSAEQVSPESY